MSDISDFPPELRALSDELDISFEIVEDEHDREHLRVMVPLSLTRACFTGLCEAVKNDDQVYLRRFAQYVVLKIEDELWEGCDDDSRC